MSVDRPLFRALYRFHSASQRPGQSITDFVRELKSLAGTCEFTNEQLGDSLRDRFICGLRSEQIKRKLLSANYTFQEAVDAAIAQETAQKDVRDLGSNSHGDNSSANVNRVKRDNFASRGRTSVPIQRHGRNDKQPQRTEDKKKRCFRCGLTNHTPDSCKYRNSECFKCHQTGHLQSECRNAKSTLQKPQEKQHVRHADQDSENEVSEDAGDEFLRSIFNLNGAHSSDSQNSVFSAPAVKVPVRTEDVEFRMEIDTGAQRQS